jgi:hypothetical protein
MLHRSDWRAHELVLQAQSWSVYVMFHYRLKQLLLYRVVAHQLRIARREVAVDQLDLAAD